MNKPLHYFVLLFLLVSSCSKDKEDCGCEGSTRRVLENTQARYIGEGTFIVPDFTNESMKVKACDINPSWIVSKDSSDWNYTIWGNLKARCLGPHPERQLPAPGGPIQIIHVEKN